MRLRLVTVLIVLAVVVACSSSDSNDVAAGTNSTTGAAAGTVTEAPDEPPGGSDICALATDDEISAIVGNPVVGTVQNATLCEYSLVSGAPAVDGTSVDVFANAASEDTCELEFDVAGATDETPIDGVGAIAYWGSGAQTPQLFVCTGTTFITISQYKPSDVSDDEALARARDIAAIVLAAL